MIDSVVSGHFLNGGRRRSKLGGPVELRGNSVRFAVRSILVPLGQFFTAKRHKTHKREVAADRCEAASVYCLI
jgi:hypothetical protein